MTLIPRYAGMVARAIIGAFTGSSLAQDSVEASGEADVAEGMSALARRAAAEGCVLLENDGTLPLDPTTPIAVFGRRQLDWVHVGNGSGGDVNAPYLTNLIDGLDDVGVRYDHVLANVYRTWCAEPAHAADPGFWGHWPQSLPEMPVSRELAQAAAADAEIAVVVIGRCAGEDQDLTPTPGSYYLREDERAMLDAVCEAFENTVVILDTCNVIDLAWLDDHAEKISAVLFAWPGGMEAGHAVADVLYGRVNPSGRLTCAIARTLEGHPSSQTFGTTPHQEYPEGVFVGHRYLSTYAPREIRYPLGHGLSYTSFSVEGISCELTSPDEAVDDSEHTGEEELHAIVRVTNTGTRPGRNVIPLWCEPPRGDIKKPLLLLAAFAKTSELAPGASEEIELHVPLVDISCFDPDRHAFVLEAGTYFWRADDTVVGKVALEKDLTFGTLESISTDGDNLRARILRHLQGLLADENQHEGRPDSTDTHADVDFADVAAGRATLDDFVTRLSVTELEALTRGAGTMNSPLGPAGNAGAFGGITPSLEQRGIPTVICADGPSGARLAQPCSLVPCATALASTWDVKLVRDLFEQVGIEVSDAGVNVLLAPGMNLQRSPLCGRNFEYFSEDPILTGHMATAVVQGLRAGGAYACPKHFAANNQERGRNTLDARLDERTLREVYLRPFQICVRDARPRLIMTSYNKINGVWSHYNFDLASTVLRDEWGFTGVVITDWWMRRAQSPEFPALRDNAYRVRAGVDVLMPGNMSRVARGYRVDRSLLETLGKPDGITLEELRLCARRVLALILEMRSALD